MMLLFLLSAPVCLLFWPTRAYGWLLAVLLPTYCFQYWALARPISISDDWGPLNQGLGMLVLLIGLAALALRATLASFVPRYMTPLSQMDARPTSISLAAIATFWIGWWFAEPVARLIGALWVLIAALLAMLIIFVGSRRMTDQTRKLCIWAALATALAGLIGILNWPAIVVRAAEMRAEGQGYCLLVADGHSDYRAAESLIDLTPLTLRASESGGHAMNRHGLLQRADGTVWNWSYFNASFEKDRRAPLLNACTMQPGFAKALPALG